MPFIEMPLGDVRESAPVPEGRYDLVIVSAKEEASRKKRDEEGEDAEPNMLHCTFAIRSEEYPNASPFGSWFMYPDGEDENIDQMRMRELKRLLHWFKVPSDDTGFNTDDVEGCEGESIPVGQDVTNTGRTVNTLALEYIPEDGEEAEAEAEAEAEEETEVEEEAEEEPPEEPEEEEEEVEEEAEEEEEEPVEEEEVAKPAPRRSATKPAPKRAAQLPAKRPIAKSVAKKAAKRGR